MNTQCLDLDLHRLDLRFAGARVAEPRAVERIARSIERGGQIVPCIAVADPPVEVLEGGERLVLIDGYRRIAALRGWVATPCVSSVGRVISPRLCSV
jgi:ParB family transcriptional regulator, chromosome partitioning protein